jgi:hypothetical protein
MCDLEQRLQLAMVSTVGGRRPAVTCEKVLAALRWRGVPVGTVSCHTFAPESFLVVFESRELRDHVAAIPAVVVAGAPPSFRPWNRQAQATLVPMRSRVTLVLEGVPPHAWDTAVVEDLLGNGCRLRLWRRRRRRGVTCRFSSCRLGRPTWRPSRWRGC